MKSQGFTKVANELFTTGTSLSNAAFRIYAVLASFRNEQTGLICPSVRKIAERSGMKERSVANALRELSQEGWIEKQRRFSRSTVYKLKGLSAAPLSPRSNEKYRAISESVLFPLRSHAVLQ